MPDRKKTTQGDKRMTKNTSAARRAGDSLDEASGHQSHSPESSQPSHRDHGKASPLFGEAALNAAFAEFRGAPNTSGALGTAPGGSSQAKHHAGGAQGQAIPAPKTVAQVLGEITWLMTQSPRHKAIPLGDLEWLVMPAILLKQFRMFYNGEQPVGVAMWALVDDFVAKRIDANDRRLTAVEWKSGPHQRIIELVAPFGGEGEMREQVAAAKPIL